MEVEMPSTTPRKLLEAEITEIMAVSQNLTEEEERKMRGQLGRLDFSPADIALLKNSR